MTIDDWLQPVKDGFLRTLQFRFRYRVWAKKERATNRMKDRILVNVRRCYQRTRALLDRLYVERFDRLNRHEQMRQAWLNDLKKAQDWKDACYRRACTLCDDYAADGDDLYCLRCGHHVRSNDREMPIVFWKGVIDRLSGFVCSAASCHRIQKGDEWANALQGLPGARGCGPMSWDNAVRALEDG